MADPLYWMKQRFKYQDRVEAFFSSLMQKSVFKKLGDAIKFSGTKMSPGRWLFYSVLNGLLLGVIFTLIAREVYSLNFLTILAGIFSGMVVYVLAFYYVLVYISRTRATHVEDLMPDALQLVASNLRANIPIHKSLLLAARPEFGILGKEFDRIGDEMLAGASMDRAFTNMGGRIDSRLIRRISKLITESIQSGTDLAGLLSEMAVDIRAFKILEIEARSNIASYLLFIVVAVLFIAPLLFAVSISFVELSNGIKGSLELGDLTISSSVPGASLAATIVEGSPLSVDLLTLFAMANLMVAGTSAALVVSVLQTGEALQKLPYIPAFILFAVMLFLSARFTISWVLTGLFL